MSETMSPAEQLAAQVVDVIKAELPTIDSLNELNALRQAEVAGKNRTTVLAAINARLAQLAPTPENEPVGVAEGDYLVGRSLTGRPFLRSGVQFTADRGGSRYPVAQFTDAQVEAILNDKSIEVWFESEDEPTHPQE